VRLLVLGAKLDAEYLMAQCVKELGATPMHLATALGMMEGLPAEMDAYPEVRALREQAWTALVKYVEVSGDVPVPVEPGRR
jgi:hypothetical protein